MQGSNSIWKLTALAGVVGLGLLGILQFQRMMDRKPSQTAETKVRLEDFKPPSELDDLGQQHADRDPPQGNTEPQRLKTSARKLDELAEDDDDSLSMERLPKNNSRPIGRNIAGTRVNNGGQASVGGMTGVPNRFKEFQEEEFSPDQSDQSEPTPTKTTRPRFDVSLNEPSANFDNDEPATTPDKSAPAVLPVVEEEPPTEPRPQPKGNAKTQAQQLVQLARKLLDNGLLDEARLKAAEAAELPATYEPLEDTPQAVLAEIDRLTANEPVAAPRRQPIQLAGSLMVRRSRAPVPRKTSPPRSRRRSRRSMMTRIFSPTVRRRRSTARREFPIRPCRPPRKRGSDRFHSPMRPIRRPPIRPRPDRSSTTRTRTRRTA